MSEASKVKLFVTPEQVSRCIALTWEAHRLMREMGLGENLSLPVALIGGTGVGKTVSVKAFHSRLDAHFQKKEKKRVGWYKMLLSLFESSELGGYIVPNMERKRAEHLMVECLPFDTDETAIIFGDEFDRATPEVQNTYLQILLGGDFHGHRLSENAYNVLALNGSSDIYTTPLSAAARTRICTLFVGGNLSDVIESYDAWAESMKMPMTIRAFNRFVPLTRPVVEFEELAEDTLRTRDMAAIVSLARDRVDDTERFRTDDIYFPIIAGLIGSMAASQFVQMEKVIKEGGVMPDDIFSDPADADVPKEVSYVHFLLEACIGSIKADKRGQLQRAKACCVYGKRLRQEWQQIWRFRIGQAFPDVVKEGTYMSWNPR
jgi:hypothetical protein